MLYFLASLLLCSCAIIQSDLLMSWDDYARQPGTNPYVLEMDSQGGSLLYYGAFHKVDPSHPQFKDIEQKWDDFQPTLVYCEGNIWPLEESRNEAIKNYGEQGLVTFLAARDRIPVECIDPSLADQVKYLKNCYPPHLIKVYYVLRQAAINRMLEKDIHDCRYANCYFRELDRIFGRIKPPTNLKDFERTVSFLFPDLCDWKKIPYSYFRDPESGGFLTAIHRKLNKFRDRTMIRKVKRALKRGKRVFAIVGRSHVVIQEAALKSLT